ncbi:MAG: hypothetical protein ABI600_11985 [Luteolibacter sp.]
MFTVTELWETVILLAAAGLSLTLVQRSAALPTIEKSGVSQKFPHRPPPRPARTRRNNFLSHLMTVEIIGEFYVLAK